MATKTADPYETLGVARDADEAAIRTAYRTLAKKHHPDLNPGKADAAERFRAIAAANELLSDPEKRARYDRGEIDAEGQERARPSRSYRDYASAGAGQDRYTEDSDFDLGGFEAGGLDEILAQAFARKRGTSARFPMRGLDAQYGLTVSFVDAASGVPRRITLPDGKTLDVTIPPGTETGTVLRLRGQGGQGRDGGANGDALIEVTVAPDPRFRREGDDIVLTVPVTLKEAVLGAALTVPTVKGDVRVTVPPGSGTGTRLRLRGRGVRGGHQYVELTVSVPPGDDPALAAFLRDWTPRSAARTDEEGA